MKKRLFAAFVSLCLIVSMLPTMAFAEAGVQYSTPNIPPPRPTHSRKNTPAKLSAPRKKSMEIAPSALRRVPSWTWFSSVWLLCRFVLALRIHILFAAVVKAVPTLATEQNILMSLGQNGMELLPFLTVAVTTTLREMLLFLKLGKLPVKKQVFA